MRTYLPAPIIDVSPFEVAIAPRDTALPGFSGQDQDFSGAVTGATNFASMKGTNYRAINDIVAMVTVSEDHEDDLVITEHPVEYGAAITDHSYKRPSEVRLEVGWSQSYGIATSGQADHVDDVKVIYQNLLDLQASRNPFTLYTGKKVYKNMLVANIRVRTEARFEWALLAEVSLRQIQLVRTQTIAGKAANPQALANPQSNAAPQEQGEKAAKPATPTSSSLQSAGATVTFEGVDAPTGDQQGQVIAIPPANQAGQPIPIPPPALRSVGRRLR